MRAAPVVVVATLFVATSFAGAQAAGNCPAPPANHPSTRWRDQYVWRTLAKSHYTIGQIRIHVAQVYDLDKPGENAWYSRLADSLHIKTRPGVVRNLLLFKSGDPVRAPLIYQTERRLRSYKFLRKATIAPVACHDGRVDVDVDVKDAWTLKPEVAYERIGGQNIVSFQLKDENLLGLGKTLAVGHIHGTQRDQNYASYFDPALAGSAWELLASASSLSDGYSRQLSIDRPFFADATAWSSGASFLTQKVDVNFYNDSERAWVASDQTRQLSVSWRHLLAWDGVSGLRAGLRYVDESWRYGPLIPLAPTLRPRPALPDRQFRGLQGTLNFFQDRYATFYNLAQIGRTEDYNLGWTASAAIGFFPTALGSSSDAWIGGLSATFGARLPWQSVIFINTDIGGRHTQNAWRGSYAGLAATWYDQAFRNHTLVAHVSAEWQLRPDPEDQLYLGGLAGLRGYPNYLRAGDRRWTLTLEDRIFTPTTFLNTFKLGYVAFLDAGQIDRPSGRGFSQVLSNIGGGLRIGNARGAFDNVIYVTVAVPLARPAGVAPYQIIIGDVVGF
ncbi:MAG TPA: hypothetical protein VFH85_10280 [Gammaproteobacteria bacterium]|nr:hypothetical protein [Gammaproteobacteria bacterium]